MSKDFIVIHHSATEDGKIIRDFDSIKAGHLRIGDRDIGYHWVLEEVNGALVWIPGRDEADNAAACPGKNYTGIHICVVGNFQIETPTEEHYKMVAQKIREIKARWTIREIGGHRDYYPTACPGKNFDVKKVIAMANGKAEEHNPSSWASTAVTWCIRNNISDGSRPQEPATREEVMVMIYKALNKK